jgi:hypothetical protein
MPRYLLDPFNMAVNVMDTAVLTRASIAGGYGVAVF